MTSWIWKNHRGTAFDLIMATMCVLFSCMYVDSPLWRLWFAGLAIVFLIFAFIQVRIENDLKLIRAKIAAYQDYIYETNNDRFGNARHKAFRANSLSGSREF